MSFYRNGQRNQGLDPFFDSQRGGGDFQRVPRGDEWWSGFNAQDPMAGQNRGGFDPKVTGSYLPSTRPQTTSGGDDMGWLDNIIRGAAGVYGARRDNRSGQTGTPPYNPNATTPGVQSGPQQDIGGWEQWLPYFLNLGTDFVGAGLQARAQGRGNDAIRERTAMLDKLGAGERARRDFYAQTLTPNLLRGTGFDKKQISDRMRQYPL